MLFALSHGLTAPLAPGIQRAAALPRRAVSMFEELVPQPAPAEAFELRSSVTTSRKVSPREGCSVVVTEGTGSFFRSRNLVQMLHDFGEHKAIIAHSKSAATAKKSLLSRSARYTGLLDVLSFSEGEMAGADAWLAINADESALPAQIDAARGAGVKRVFVLLTEDGPTACPADVEAMEAQLKASGMAFTVMRTGTLDESSSGSGLRLGELDEAVCGAVGKEDVYRFVTEALTLPAAEGRLFSLCPSTATQEGLREMRLCGYTRRDEVDALLKGLVPGEADTAAGTLTEAEAAAEAELVLRSAEEVAAERAEEVERLMARARARGAALEAKAKEEEEEKAKLRAEQQKYYAKPDSPEPSEDKPSEDA